MCEAWSTVPQVCTHSSPSHHRRWLLVCLWKLPIPTRNVRTGPRNILNPLKGLVRQYLLGSRNTGWLFCGLCRGTSRAAWDARYVSKRNIPTYHRDGGANPFYFGCRNNRTNCLADHAEFHSSNTSMQAGQNQLNQMDPLHDSMMTKQNDGYLNLFKACYWILIESLPIKKFSSLARNLYPSLSPAPTLTDPNRRASSRTKHVIALNLKCYTWEYDLYQVYVMQGECTLY